MKPACMGKTHTCINVATAQSFIGEDGAPFRLVPMYHLPHIGKPIYKPWIL